MKILDVTIKNYRSINENEVKIDFANTDLLFLIGQNSAGKTNIMNAYDLFWNTDRLVDNYDFYYSLTDKPIEIEVTISTDKPSFQKICFEPNKVKIKQKLTKNSEKINKREYFYFDSQSDDYVTLELGEEYVKDLPMPVWIPGLTQIENTSKAISNFLDVIFRKRISVKLANGETLDDAVRKSPIMQFLQSRLNQSISNVFEEITFLPYMGRDKNITLESEGVDREKGHIKIKVRIDEQPLSNEVIIGLQNLGDAVKRQLLIAWALNKDFFDYVADKSITNEDIENFKPVEKLILFEEPEAFSHPSAIRSLQNEIYKISSQKGIQIICTTHSPIFIDLSNESGLIVRVVKEGAFTKVHHFKISTLTGDDKEHMNFLLRFNPYVLEAFFAERVLLVEGQTEEISIKTAIKNLEKYKEKYDLKKIDKTLVVNCGSKTNINFFQEKLRRLKIPYIVFHDLDNPSKINVWTINYRIQAEIKAAKEEELDCQIYIFKEDFEKSHYYEHKTNHGKPFSAFKYVEEINFANKNKAKKITLVKFLLDAFKSKVPVKIANFDERYLNEFKKGYIKNKESHIKNK
ncbi:ATP-dependent nuclease [Priestia aryabhattai]|uniref:ATP-dependent nuclease n=1 Tax=Priestia aryabhattai TaxID=412384 RepID=UPI000532E99E|nr:AAA family ATPase [Priestia aryabhattai]